MEKREGGKRKEGKRRGWRWGGAAELHSRCFYKSSKANKLVRSQISPTFLWLKVSLLFNSKI